MNYELSMDDYDLLLATYCHLRRHLGFHVRLSLLFGYPNFFNRNLSADDRGLCEMLISSHWYPVYRMLLIKHGLNESQIVI